MISAKPGLGNYCPAEFSSNPNQTHLNKLISVFKITRNLQDSGPPGLKLASPACTWGVAFEVTGSQVEESLKYLNVREAVIGGYLTQIVEFFPQGANQSPVQALVYIATPDNPIYLGPASTKEIAARIAVCKGKSGHNIEYLLRLAEFMRVSCPDVDDPHLFSIEAAVLQKEMIPQ
uniref:Gamma-glutamylcyclotransferase n=1 Tax=Sinocyclocheilus grahami TaxID=75366 RepID=A0A672SF77_SINGR